MKKFQKIITLQLPEKETVKQILGFTSKNEGS